LVQGLADGPGPGFAIGEEAKPAHHHHSFRANADQRFHRLAQTSLPVAQGRILADIDIFA
jgi:hypothetical protein